MRFFTHCTGKVKALISKQTNLFSKAGAFTIFFQSKFFTNAKKSKHWYMKSSRFLSCHDFLRAFVLILVCSISGLWRVSAFVILHGTVLTFKTNSHITLGVTLFFKIFTKSKGLVFFPFICS